MPTDTNSDLCRPPLSGGFNLRDFGGYETVDGRRVRRGMLYRSGTMALLTEADGAYLRGLGIRTICDFRRQNERVAEPTRWHDEATEYYCRDYEETSGILMTMLREDGATVEDMRQAMLQLYRTLHVDHAESYRAMFQRLDEGRVPMLINCAAGKDRTGVGAALILEALGVRRDDIVHDYVLTNIHADWEWLLAQPAFAKDHAVTNPPPADIVTALKTADAVYLDAFYAQLHAEHGGVDGYLQDVLGVDAAGKARLRDRLLET